MKTTKKVLCGIMAIFILTAGLTGCKKSEQTSTDGAVKISIGDWPQETNPKGQQQYAEYLAQMNEKYPNVEVTPDEGNFTDPKIFQMKAMAEQLPTLFASYYTEVQQTTKQGYVADLTDIMNKFGLIDAMNPAILDLVKGEDGKVYAFPTDSYLMGLTINKKLFEEAGLVNEDGTVKVPDTYQQLAEYAQIIKEKTGQAGYAICTTNNCGGWHFMNIAWSFGVNFMKQRDDGTWEATFNTQEARDALQYIKDLKWKYDVLPTEINIDQEELHKLLAVNRAAMIFDGPSDSYTQKYGMNVDDVVIAKMPEGPAGRFVQMGGIVRMFAKNATPEEIEACFNWLSVIGMGATLDEKAVENKKSEYKTKIENKGLVLPDRALPIWTSEERLKQEREIAAEYTNVDAKNFETYFDTSNVTLRPEEPICCQQLYAVLDGCIQEVITNENADVAELIEKACNDFQVNHLDKI